MAIQKMYYDKLELATMLGVSLRTVDAMIKVGDLKYVKLATGLVRIPVDVVNEMIAKRTMNQKKKL